MVGGGAEIDPSQTLLLFVTFFVLVLVGTLSAQVGREGGREGGKEGGQDGCSALLTNFLLTHFFHFLPPSLHSDRGPGLRRGQAGGDDDDACTGRTGGG